MCLELVLSKMKSINAIGDIKKQLILEDARIIYQKYFEEYIREWSHSDNDIKPLLANQSEHFTCDRKLLTSITNQSENLPASDEDVWIFGYGSLIWKVDFPFIDRRPGFIRGYQRKFFQNSIDHRGTPTRPGRVVTLIPTQNYDDRVYGMAYRIPCKHKQQVLLGLDHREKNGYERCVLSFYEFPESKNNSFDVIMYIATASNESYAGDVSDMQLIADQIFTSAGPSGSNREYLFNLAKAMRTLFPGVNDDHLFELENEVLRRVECKETEIIKSILIKKIASILSENMANDAIQNSNCIKKIENDLLNLKNNLEQPGWKENYLHQVIGKEN